MVHGFREQQRLLKQRLLKQRLLKQLPRKTAAE
jgi:hypothetical protein